MPPIAKQREHAKVEVVERDSVTTCMLALLRDASMAPPTDLIVKLFRDNSLRSLNDFRYPFCNNCNSSRCGKPITLLKLPSTSEINTDPAPCKA